MDSSPIISAICPTFNEEEHIAKIIEFFLSAQPERKELLIVDGNSTDKTTDIVKEYSLKYPQIKLLNNPKRFSPFALNIGIKNSSGDIIVHTNGHSEYRADFYLKILDAFKKSEADIVGGPIRTRAKTALQNAIGYVTSTVFGVGGSKSHLEEYEGLTDSVYTAAVKKEVFDKIGLFDERLIKNQDDEFNYRANEFGLKVYQSKDIYVWYYPKNSVSALAKHYFLFGVYKPLVLAKVKSGISLRHLVPTLFALYLLSTFIYNPTIYYLPLVLYLLLDLYFSFSSSKGIKEKLYSLFLYPIIHLSYGIGFLKGIFFFKKNNKK